MAADLNQRRDTLRKALKATKLTKSDFARLLEMDLRTLRRQFSGESPISGPTHAIYHLLAYMPEETMAMLDADLMLGTRRA
jgi:DNA-binding transcriptional regulator YiaG